MSESQTYSFRTLEQPKPAGFWRVGDGGLRLYVMRRPSWLARLCSGWLLQWTWEDNDEESKS